jgi:hypothetical protein
VCASPRSSFVHCHSTTGTDHATLIHRCVCERGSAHRLLRICCGNMCLLCRHPAGCVGGTSVIEFLALPARASVTVTFASESPGQGFLWLLKL